tara:strand:- start:615 stop:875 length:261 start_codon:yes stop_codon:yes gene_type:complete
MGKKIKKITDDQLAKVKDLQHEINTLLLNIGNAELVKVQLTNKHVELKQEWDDLTKLLEEEYGSVNISLEDGSISELKESKDKPEV